MCNSTVKIFDIERWSVEETEILDNVGCSSECSTEDTDRDGASLIGLESRR